jgi:hypothetical protein
MLRSLAIRELEMRSLNDRLAAASPSASVPTSYSRGRPASPHAAGATSHSRPGSTLDPAAAAAATSQVIATDGSELPDDDPGYLAFLRLAGLDADALLSAPRAAAAGPRAASAALGGGGEMGGGAAEEESGEGAGFGPAEAQGREGGRRAGGWLVALWGGRGRGA